MKIYNDNSLFSFSLYCGYQMIGEETPGDSFIPELFQLSYFYKAWMKNYPLLKINVIMTTLYFPFSLYCGHQMTGEETPVDSFIPELF